MSRTALTLQALGERLAQPTRAMRNRLMAHRARLGTRPQVAKTLPEPVLVGDADLGEGLIAGRWVARGQVTELGAASIWQARLADPALEAERQGCLWLDDLAALKRQRERERELFIEPIDLEIEQHRAPGQSIDHVSHVFDEIPRRRRTSVGVPGVRPVKG